MADDPTYEPELADIEALLRELDEADLAPDAPPADVWAGIETELGDELTAPAAGAAHDRVIVTTAARWRRRWAVPLLAAAAVVVVVAGIAVLANRSSTTTVARARLVYDPASFDPEGASATAEASLVDEDGRELIEITDAVLPFDLQEDAALELWLIEVDSGGDVVDLVSLGDIEPDGTRSFAVPAGYDPTLYSVVDISIEPHDGDASHSGRSILRGSLVPT